MRGQCPSKKIIGGAVAQSPLCKYINKVVHDQVALKLHDKRSRRICSYISYMIALIINNLYALYSSYYS